MLIGVHKLRRDVFEQMLTIFGFVYDVYASLGLTELGHTVQFVFVEFALLEILCFFCFHGFLEFFE